MQRLVHFVLCLNPRPLDISVVIYVLLNLKFKCNKSTVTERGEKGKAQKHKAINANKETIYHLAYIAGY